MKVKEVTTLHLPVCQAAHSWRRAGAALWEGDAGIAVVLDEEQRPVGVITEGDICRAVATRRILPRNLSAADLVTGLAPTCGLDDDVRTALQRMAVHRVRALPVVARDGTMVGLVTIQRILLRAKEGTGWTPREVVKVLCEVWADHLLPEDSVACGWEHR